MARIRVILVACATGLALVLLSGPAAATHSASVTAPADGSTIENPVEMRAAVHRGVGQSVSSVRVRAIQNGSTHGSPSSLACLSSCGGFSQSTETWGGQTLNPRSPSAFGSSTPLRNGPTALEVSVNGGSWMALSDVVVSYPPSPVGGLNASADDRRVSVSWSLPPEPDITGFRVEHRRNGGPWSLVGTRGPTATSFSHTVGADGAYDYRVFTVRPDARGGEFHVASALASVVAVNPPPEPTPSPTPTPGPGGESTPPPGSGTGPTPGPTSPGAPAPGDGGGDSGDEAGDGSGVSPPRTPPQGRASRVAPPPRIGPGMTLGAEPDPQTAPGTWGSTRERHFGEDDPWDETLDYGEIDPITGEPIEPGGRGSGSGTEYVETLDEIRILDERSLFVSLAAGLLFITLGLHVYNWMRQT